MLHHSCRCRTNRHLLNHLKFSLFSLINIHILQGIEIEIGSKTEIKTEMKMEMNMEMEMKVTVEVEVEMKMEVQVEVEIKGR